MSFRGVDYFCVDSLFGEEELMVPQTERRFAEERIVPVIRDCWRDARLPVELVPDMIGRVILSEGIDEWHNAGDWGNTSSSIRSAKTG
jgi:glutaryl-CoA dehydrogenase